MNLSQSNGMDTLALTDVNGMWGFIRFVQHCKDAGIRPIAGTNLITGNDDLILLAENQYGYENMCRVVSAAHDDPNQSAADILEKRLAGIFVLAHKEHTLKKLITFVPDTHLFL
jgi:error-prone DNA polymerase